MQAILLDFGMIRRGAFTSVKDLIAPAQVKEDRSRDTRKAELESLIGSNLAQAVRAVDQRGCPHSQPGAEDLIALGRRRHELAALMLGMATQTGEVGVHAGVV